MHHWDACEKHVAFVQAGVALFVLVVLVIFTRPLAEWIFGVQWVRLCQNLTAFAMGLQAVIFVFRWRSLDEDHHN
jgi:hypothetical protein